MISRMSRSYPIRWLPVLTLLLDPALLAAQEDPAAGAGDPFFESVDVHVVNVEVFVTDRKGNPVTGLTRDDFELSEDGRRVPITNFYAVAGGRPAVAETAGAGAPPDDVLRSDLRLSPLLEEQLLHLVVYVDNFNIRPFDRNQVFARLHEFLRRLSSGDRVMLVSYDRSLHVRHRFTSDRSSIAAALFDLEEAAGHRLEADRERQRILSAIDDADAPAAISGRVRQHASSIANDLRFTLDALRDIVGSLAGLPGRKALLYVSDGLPMRPAQDLFHAVQRKFGDMSVMAEISQWDMSRKFDELAAQANGSGVTFYTIDASGLQLFSSSTAENARPSSIDGGDVLVDQLRLQNLQSSIRFLAERTGGTAIFNTNDFGPGLARVATDFDTYYSLGYVPAHAGDGRYHRIEVKTVGKGLTVRHRDGYRDKPPSARMKERTASSLRYGYGSNPLGIGLVVDTPSPHDEDDYVVPVLFKIPLGRIALVPRGEVYEGRVQVYFQAMDDEGKMSDVREDTIPIEIPAADLEAARSQHYAYRTQLLMRRGHHRFGAGVRDEYGAVTSFVSIGVEAGSG